MFFERMRKEIKRSLKVTMDTIKRPESLGARRKDKATSRMYPSLPTTVEITEEDKTLKWVNDSSRITAHVDKATVNRDPPDYELSEESRKTAIQIDQPRGSDRPPKRDIYRSAPPSYDGNQLEPTTVAAGHPPAEITGKTNAPSREETEEEKKERKKQQLERRRVPLES